MKIAGVWPGHDCSFCVLEDGHPIIHAELERYNREKSPPGDAIEFMFERSTFESQELVHIASVHPTKKTKQYSASYKKAEEIVTKNGLLKNPNTPAAIMREMLEGGAIAGFVKLT